MSRISIPFKTLGIATAVSLCVIAACQAGAIRSDAEKAIIKKLGGLRGIADAQRSGVTRDLALEIRKLPAGANKASLAYSLANLATEGDFGRDTLQEVTTTLAQSLTETHIAGQGGQPHPGFDELAQLSKYEHMKVSINSADYKASVANLNKVDADRAKVDFSLTDIEGHSWTLSSLKGKVVLVNFWATWCPPCRKEMPDLQMLSDRFKAQGFVVLSISDEGMDKVKPFIADHKYTWPVVLDPGRKVNDLYHIQGIPKSFLYNRNGQLIEQTIDMRTQAQFLSLLAKAGLK